MSAGGRRVALVTHRFPPQLGGVEHHVAELARRLPDHGWEAEVLTEGPANASERTPEGVRVLRFRRPLERSPYATAPGLWRHLRRHAGAYDLVHGHNFHAFPALAAALFARGPFAFTPHYHGLGTSRLGRGLHRPYRPAGRRLVRRAGAIVCVSRAEAERFEADFPEARPRVRVIPNGIDTEALARAARLDVDEPVILTAGRLHPYKRLDRVLDAFARLATPARLVVLGDGPARAAVAARAVALGLGARAAFPGTVARPELDAWLRTAAVYVSLSEQEAFGIGVAEGAGAGARVVASDIPAHREIAAMAPGAVDLVAPDAPAEAVAAALRRALATPAPPGAARGIPGWDEVAGRTAALYDELWAAWRAS